MLRVHSNTKLEGFTEYEEETILFDPDDPDFGGNTLTNVPIIFATVRRNMSIASVHPAEIHSSHSSLATLSHSLEDITTTPTSSWSSSPIPPYLHHLNYNTTINNQNDHVLTIEELRLQMTTCFTCGVSWNDKHVSLDCSECGGYALERPCIECDGKCGAVWKRDLSMSHASSKARWQGECSFKQQQQQSSITTTTTTTTTTKTEAGGDVDNKNDDVDKDSHELAAKLEKLSANS